MLETLRSVASLLTSYSLLLIAMGLYGTLLTVRMKLEDFPTDVIGIVASANFLGLLIGARFAPSIIGIVGHIRSFAAFVSILSIVALLHALYVDALFWFVLRLCFGFCLAGMFTVTESWLNARATNDNRGRVLAFYMIVNYAGAGLGQFLLPTADPGEFHLFATASILFSLALIPILLTSAQAPVPETPERMPLRALWRISPLGFSTTIGAGLIAASFHGLGAVFARDIGLNLQQTSIFMACTIFGGLLLQYPLGLLSDRIGRRWVIAGVGFATAMCSIAINALAGGPLIALYVVMTLFGSVVFCLYSLGAAITNDRAPEHARVEVASGVMTAYSIGAICGPILAAQAMNLTGPAGMFHYSGLIALFVATLSLGRIIFNPLGIRRRQVFVPMPQQVPVAEEMLQSIRETQHDSIVVAPDSASAPQEFNVEADTATELDAQSKTT